MPLFPIVGIGASAGGLSAFEAFFSGMPADKDPGMAFVLVQHLAPDHTSILSEIIRRYTRMDVFEVEDGMQVQINCVYIIPPARNMAFLNGALHLLEPGEPRGQRLAIDFFFHSLAQDQRARSIGVILSGTGSDGSQGARAIKAEGGMVTAQDPASTEFDGMPRSAIDTGLVDDVLPPAQMAARLIAYAARPSGKSPRPRTAPPLAENAMRRAFILLRAQTGHDFSNYKVSTITRRIERRMGIHQIDGLDSYVKMLQQTPAEVEALFRDLLIGVTNFFRDPDVFRTVEDQVMPKLFEGKPPGAVVRIWSAGCSTGEEAYSLAILLAERMEGLEQSGRGQVFATDIDSRAIATARAGVFPASIAADITPERLARFFTAHPNGGGYRINKSIRDMLVFSEQDVLRDPPFSRLDMVSCRNLLIYLDAKLQQKLIPLFHYALNPEGVLLLGTSEGIGAQDDLFAALDHKSKLYSRRQDLAHRSSRSSGPPAPAAKDAAPCPAVGLPSHRGASGPAAAPETSPHPDVLEEGPEPPKPAARAASGQASPAAGVRIAALEQELRAKEELLQSAHEELETSTEELKSSNEEMQSVNEELQSTNEELETAKEEMQSVNEELSTVNAELQDKVAGLSQASNDMNNLIAGTNIATVFVDFDLCILRFTPAATEIINLIPGDVGRPVSHIASNLAGHHSLLADIQAVLKTLEPRVADVRTTAGRWFTLRIQPYRTLANVVEGAVITFVDITERKQAAEALRKANDVLRLAVVVRDAHDAITVQDLEGRMIAWNPGAVRMYGWNESEALLLSAQDRIPEELRAGALDKLHQLSRSKILKPYLTRRITKEGKVVEVSIITTALVDEAGHLYAIATTERGGDQAEKRPGRTRKVPL